MARRIRPLLRTGLPLIAALAVFAPTVSVRASSDVTCTPSWRVAATEASCENRVVISPENDTRVNLLLLLRDRLPAETSAGAYPKPDYPNQDFGRVFFDWPALQSGYWPDGRSAFDANGSVCVSLGSGDMDFAKALATNPAIPAAERAALTAARARLTATCEAAEGPKAEWPGAIASTAGKAFLAYLQAADAFYAGHWDTARQGFADLLPALKAKPPVDPWLAEVARYMVARTDLNAAMAKAFDEWGDFAGPDKVDKPTLLRAREGLRTYIAAYPLGAYADSARGLVRRSIWLEGDTRALAQVYDALLGSTAPDHPDVSRLVQEIDAKLLFAKDAGAAIEGPLLLATWDLMRMRQFTADASGAPEPAHPVLSAADLDGQAARFARRPDLFRYLQAVHAFRVQHDYRRVLQLVPDDARREAFTPLAFSRQILRGLALAAMKDPAEAGFWRDLLSGAKGLWQRPTVELALALNYERHGQLAAVFASGSPITEQSIREILLMHGASPALLRSAALATDRPKHERDIALFTLLYKQLSRGDYAGFLVSRGLVPGDADTKGGLWDFIAAETIPVGVFSVGETASAAYACPSLATTASVLAKAPRDTGALLCLGEFWRLNGFDGFTQLDQSPKPDELGGVPSLFPGAPLARGTIYARIIADRTAPADARAYALYRAVNCYAPSAYNGCGGADVPVGQRRAWFNQLKRDYPASRWARALQYYW